jgi:hypothetical protein
MAMMRRVGFLAFCGILAVQQITPVTAIAQDQKFTCQVYGGSFVLDDTDFQALASQHITREKFSSFAPTSKERMAVCDTRKLWRVIKSAKNYPLRLGHALSEVECRVLFADRARNGA